VRSAAERAGVDVLLRAADRVSDPARKLSDVFTGIQGGIAAADRLFPVLDRQPKICDPAQPRPLHDRTGGWSSIMSRSITRQATDLQDINLTVPFGETCVLWAQRLRQDHAGQSAAAVL